ncbi:hypothetical protein LY41_000820 [Prauserella halophila]|nr:hypothetical protein [Prauserella halophila]
MGERGVVDILRVQLLPCGLQLFGELGIVPAGLVEPLSQGGESLLIVGPVARGPARRGRRPVGQRAGPGVTGLEQRVSSGARRCGGA